MRAHLCAVAVAVFTWSSAVHAQSAAPHTARHEPELVMHAVIPGERLQEIAERYGVSVPQVVRWNGLNAERPIIRVGRPLKVYALDPPPQRIKVRYRIRPGDSWSRIARVHGVDTGKLRKHWNPKMGDVLRAGEHLAIWTEPSPSTQQEETVDESGRTQSIGKTTRGRILGLAQLPPRPDLYTVRNANHSYGSTHAIELIQQGVATFRQRSGFTGILTIGDMSQKRGGRFRPHHSHQSGRDVDIRLPLRAGLPDTTIPERSDQVDWDATWSLVRALLDTGQVVFVFLSTTRQRFLHEAATRAGTSPEMLDELIQYPRRAATAIIRHSRGHTKHVHVRFTCAEYETRCRD